MKYFIDGDQIVITKDDFVNLQESPVVWIPRGSMAGKTIETKGILCLAIIDLMAIKKALDTGGASWKKLCSIVVGMEKYD
jgi:hypothetical protein